VVVQRAYSRGSRGTFGLILESTLRKPMDNTSAITNTRIRWYDQPCKKATGYMCKMSIRLDINSFEKNPWEKVCPQGFRDLQPWNSKFCYHVEPQKVSWSSAKENCESKNSSLATFETEEEWKHVRETWYKIGGNGWVGGRLEGNSWNWTSGKGVAMDFGWWKGQPTDNGSCIRVASHRDTGEFGWWPNDCEKTQAFLCRISSTV
jgi:hypothetical protein